MRICARRHIASLTKSAKTYRTERDMSLLFVSWHEYVGFLFNISFSRLS